MDKKRFLAGFFFFAFLAAVFEPNGNTETLRGEIKDISPEGRSFNLVRLDTRDELRIWLSIETKFQGLSSLYELAVGDEVTVEAQRNPDKGQWESHSLTVNKVVIGDPKSDTEVLGEPEGSSAVAASLEAESRRRVQGEMRKTYGQWVKEMRSVKAAAAESPALHEKYGLLTQDLDPARLEFQKALQALRKSPSESRGINRSTAEKSLEKLLEVLAALKQEIVPPRK